MISRLPLVGNVSVNHASHCVDYSTKVESHTIRYTPPPSHSMISRLPLVGNVSVNHASHCVDYSTKVEFFGVLLFLALLQLGWVQNLRTAPGGCWHHVVFMIRHLRSSYILHPSLSVEVAKLENKATHRYPYASPPHNRVLEFQGSAHCPCDSGSTALCFALGMSDACLVDETRRAPSRHY